MKLMNIYNMILSEVSLSIMKNPEKAPYMGSRFGQDVEPFGTYVLKKDFDGELSAPWIGGVAELSKPLVISVTYDTLVSWKYDLAKQYKAKNKLLTNKLMKLGYDSIITKNDDGSFGEIILFPNAKFMLHNS